MCMLVLFRMRVCMGVCVCVCVCACVCRFLVFSMFSHIGFPLFGCDRPDFFGDVLYCCFGGWWFSLFIFLFWVLNFFFKAMVQIRAPATLPEYYSFPATVGGRTFFATVPRGGIEKDQTFAFPLPLPTPTRNSTNSSTPRRSTSSSMSSSSSSSSSSKKRPRLKSGTIEPAFVPVGHWKDGLFTAFCKHGPCHPTVWNSCCCLPSTLSLSVSVSLVCGGASKRVSFFFVCLLFFVCCFPFFCRRIDRLLLPPKNWFWNLWYLQTVHRFFDVLMF